MVDFNDDTKVTQPPEPSRPEARDRAYVIVLAGSSVGEMFKVGDGETLIGRGSRAEVKVIDEGISRMHARIVREGSDYFVEDLGSKNGTFANGARIARHRLADGDKIQFGGTTILKFTYHDHLDEHFQRQMYDSALRDGLTKVFNRKYFTDRLESEFAYALRHQSALSLVMFDLDRFKGVNDVHGHLAGDSVLQHVAQIISKAIRQEDVLARYGGEEFAIICRGVDPRGAQVFGERLRKIVAATSFQFQSARIPITISVGVAGLPESEFGAPNDLVAAADSALYEAKQSGRNCVFRYFPKK